MPMLDIMTFDYSAIKRGQQEQERRGGRWKVRGLLVHLFDLLLRLLLRCCYRGCCYCSWSSSDSSQDARQDVACLAQALCAQGRSEGWQL